MVLPLSIVMAQINPVVGDLRGNADKIIAVCKNTRKADIIVFPELSLCGYPPEDLVLKPSFVTACMDMAQEIANALAELDCGAIIGTPWFKTEDQIKPYNAALLLHQGEIKAVRTKYNLPNYSVFDEKRTFTAGDLPEPVLFKNHQLGIMICEDMWSSDCAGHLKSSAADCLIVLNASPYTNDKHAQRLSLAKARCTETALPLYYCNQVGGQDEIVFDGASFSMDARGIVHSQFPCFEECISANFKTPLPDRNALIYAALKTALHDYVTKNGFPGVLLGLSGGIDSALVAVLAVDALGADNVSCYMLPSGYTSQSSLDDAAELAANLGIDLQTYSILETLVAFENTLPGLQGLAHENIQSRIRGTMLMALSNSSGKMLVTTGNKSEMACGYATIYGDMNGGYNPLKDLYKTQVFELCKWRNKQGNAPVIPQNIIDKPPSAELRDNQKDQDSLPPYDVLDDILEHLIEYERSVDEICALTGQSEELVLRIWKMLDRAEYKRYQAAPGTKITIKAFGRDRRYPMTNKFANSGL
jgi:NAD+ synthase